MTNFEATAYARIALLNLIESKSDITPDSLLYEMHHLFDLYNEDSIAKEVFFRLWKYISSRKFFLSGW